MKITDIMFKPLWYEKKSGSTLHPYQWRAAHWGLSLFFFFVLKFGFSFFTTNNWSPAIVVMIIFSVYKITKENGTRTWKDTKDFISDFSDYGIVLFVPLYDLGKLFIGIYFVIWAIVYIFTFTKGWSTPQ